MVIELTAEPAAMAELDRIFVLADEVIRHKVIRLPGQGGRPTRRGRQPRPPAVGEG